MIGSAAFARITERQRRRGPIRRDADCFARIRVAGDCIELTTGIKRRELAIEGDGVYTYAFCSTSGEITVSAILSRTRGCIGGRRSGGKLEWKDGQVQVVMRWELWPKLEGQKEGPTECVDVTSGLK